jgi:KaiC/GvpD/RAD55 family RecA-like ATPase
LSNAGNDSDLENDHKKSDKNYPSLIPGVDLPKKQSTILLLHGPSGVGKTLYCKQFLTEGLLKGDRCIFVSTALSKMQFDALFSSQEQNMFLNLLDFVNPLDRGISRSNNNKKKSLSARKLVTMMLSDVVHSLETTAKDDRKIVNTIPSSNKIHEKASTEQTRLVLDSITHLLLLLRERILMQFIMDLTSLLKHFKATAILTLTTSTND